MSGAMWGLLSLASLGGGIFLMIAAMGSSTPHDSPKYGPRGLRRAQAMQEGGLFVSFEPLIRLVAGWFAYLPVQEGRRNIDQLLKYSGDWLGLSANEFYAMTALTSFAGLVGGLALIQTAVVPPAILVATAGLMGVIPYFRVTGERDRRFKEVNRGLPAAIDLASLCMGAGLDFPGAIRQIVEKSPNKRDAIVEEFSRVLQELELGKTRRQALENMQDRVPTDSVVDFVSAVVQAEEKGNPLADVLRIQATMLRMRRTVMAEEAASKAAVKLMLPMMMIFCVVLIVLLGPFFINFLASGL